MRVTIHGKRWDLRFVSRLPLEEDVADCDAPDVKAKKIRVLKGLDPKEELDAVIHELFHAWHWDLKEEVIAEAATDIAAVLWKLGWRRAGS